MIKLGKESFFFELLPQDKIDKLIAVRICINGNMLGTLESPTYMPSFLNDLKNLISSPYYYNGNLNIDNSFEVLKESIDSGDYIVVLEETFDDYIKRFARNDVEMFFLWYIEEPFFNYSNSEKDRIFFSSVLIEDISFGINELSKWYRDYIGF
ncbi:hypothetical protein [Acinetobacter junii]|uniref:hypothetical protein n=1 Tax=Acinetobacter junii TaxID=40215 RepID=UPI0032146B57